MACMAVCNFSPLYVGHPSNWKLGRSRRWYWAFAALHLMILLAANNSSFLRWYFATKIVYNMEMAPGLHIWHCVLKFGAARGAKYGLRFKFWHEDEIYTTHENWILRMESDILCVERNYRIDGMRTVFISPTLLKYIQFYAKPISDLVSASVSWIFDRFVILAPLCACGSVLTSGSSSLFLNVCFFREELVVQAISITWRWIVQRRVMRICDSMVFQICKCGSSFFDIIITAKHMVIVAFLTSTH